jgi:hypothetical protein
VIVPGTKLDCVCGAENARIESDTHRLGRRERVVCTVCVRRSRWWWCGQNGEHRGEMLGEWREWVANQVSHETHEEHEEKE